MKLIKILMLVVMVNNICAQIPSLKSEFKIKAAACCSWSDPHGPLIPGCMSGC